MKSLISSISTNFLVPRIPKNGADQKMYRLIKKQEQAKPFLRAFQLFCNTSAFIMGKKRLNPWENTQRCYEELFDPLCAETGVCPDYTEGHYPNGDEEYNEAKVKQFDYILDQLNAKEGAKIMDLGCGNGKLLLRAVERGYLGHGITVSKKQRDECNRQGLNVKLCQVNEIKKIYAPNQFDMIVLNGPTEHFVKETDVAEGKEQGIRGEFFDCIKYLLKPGGRVFIACIHFRYKTDIHKILQNPLSHPVGSYNFQCSVLVGLYSGWYPYHSDYDNIAKSKGMKMIFERDATEDYFTTSVNWSRRVKKYLKENPTFKKKFLCQFFLKDPRYFFITFLYWWYDSWTWQFRADETGETPMWRRWVMYEYDDSQD